MLVACLGNVARESPERPICHGYLLSFALPLQEPIGNQLSHRTAFMAEMVYSRRYVRRVTRILFQVMLVTLAAALVRFVALDQHAIWLDEAISLEIVTRNTLPSLWPFLRSWDTHPPFYYQVLLLWTRVLGDSLSILRLPSVVFGVLTVPCLYVLTLLLTRRRTAFLAALLFALSPFQVDVAQEARMYSLLTLWVVLTLIFLIALLREPNLTSAGVYWIGLVLCQVGAAYTHNTAGPFLTAGLNVPVLIWIWMARRGVTFAGYPSLNTRGFALNWFTMQVVVVCMWLPWSGSFLQQTSRILQEFWIPPADIYRVWGMVSRMAFAHLPLTPEIQAIPALFMAGLALLGLIRLRQYPVPLGFLLSGMLVPVLLALGANLIQPLWHERSLNWVSLFFYVLVAAGIAGGSAEPKQAVARRGIDRLWRQQMVPGIQALVILGLTLLQVWGLSEYYQDGEREGWRDAAAYVAGSAQEGDAIVFHANWVQLPFMYHYAQLAATEQAEIPALKEIPVPEPVFTGTTAEPRMTRAQVPALKAQLEPGARTWLVYSHDWYTDPDGLVPATLVASQTQVAAEEFRKIRILLYAP